MVQISGDSYVRSNLSFGVHFNFNVKTLQYTFLALKFQWQYSFRIRLRHNSQIFLRFNAPINWFELLLKYQKNFNTLKKIEIMGKLNFGKMSRYIVGLVKCCKYYQWPYHNINDFLSRFFIIIFFLSLFYSSLYICFACHCYNHIK